MLAKAAGGLLEREEWQVQLQGCPAQPPGAWHGSEPGGGGMGAQRRGSVQHCVHCSCVRLFGVAARSGAQARMRNPPPGTIPTPLCLLIFIQRS